MPNINQKMVSFLFFTIILANGNCFVSSLIDQPLKLALSLFGGQRGRTNVAPSAPMASVPASDYPLASPPIAYTGGDPQARPIPAQNVEPWRGSGSSGGPVEPWRDNGWPGSHRPTGLNGHQGPAEPWKDGGLVDHWPRQNRHIGSGTERPQPLEPWKDDWSGGYKPKINQDNPHVKPLTGSSWNSGHLSVESWARQKFTELGKDREQPRVEPLKDDSWSAGPQSAVPWQQYVAHHTDPGYYRPRPPIEPSNDDDTRSREQINKLWKDDIWADRQHHTAPMKDHDRPRIESWNADEPMKVDGWNIEHKSWKDWNKKGLQIIPGRESDNYYDGGWNKRFRSEVSLKAGNVIPILSLAPWHKHVGNDDNVTGKKLKIDDGIRSAKNVRRQQNWQIDSAEQVNHHIIRGKVEAEASGRRPYVSVEEIPGLRSDFVIITAKPVASHGKRTYHRSAGYISGLQKRDIKPKKVTLNKEECIWCV